MWGIQSPIRNYLFISLIGSREFIASSLFLSIILYLFGSLILASPTVFNNARIEFVQWKEASCSCIKFADNCLISSMVI